MKTKNCIVRLIAVVLFLMTATSVSYAQEKQNATPEADKTSFAELKDAAIKCLTFSVNNPHAPETAEMMDKAEDAISQMEKMRDADQSDLNTLKGFQYMVFIVQDPGFNGPLYYLDVIDYYKKALAINPNHELAKHLLSKFLENMAKQRM